MLAGAVGRFSFFPADDTVPSVRPGRRGSRTQACSRRGGGDDRRHGVLHGETILDIISMGGGLRFARHTYDMISNLFAAPPFYHYWYYRLLYCYYYIPSETLCGY